MKRCTKCGEEKAKAHFQDRKDSPDGKRNECRLCKAAYMLEYGKKYYAKNREAILERTAKYKVENSDKVSAREKRRMGTPGGKYVWYKAMSKYRGVSFALTMSQFSHYWQKPCSYCGKEIEKIGLDRIRNDTGYASNNVCSCCVSCNSKKGTSSLLEFLRRETKNG